jgi:hypothetical protein
MWHVVQEQPRILSSIPGRLRVHLPRWRGEDTERIEGPLGRLPGVVAVQANPLTGNVLIHFDPEQTGPQALQTALEQLTPADTPPVFATSPMLRAGLRGLVGHALVDTLWFGGGFLGQSVGLPLAGLGPLHLLLDLCVWGAALGSVGSSPRAEAVS